MSRQGRSWQFCRQVEHILGYHQMDLEGTGRVKLGLGLGKDHLHSLSVRCKR